MKKISGFFEKFINRTSKQVNNYTSIISIIKKHTGIDLDMGNISISSGILRISSSSSVKNEIFIKKTRILKDIKDKIQSINIENIL